MQKWLVRDVPLYDGGSINKLQNGIIRLIFRYEKYEILVFYIV